jgi:aromatic ring-opening dioxygenase catalytic subunit (LigB family)
MAEIVGSLAMSHAPQLMLNPDQWGLLNTRSWDPLPVRPELEGETPEVKWTKWKRCMAAIDQLRHKIEALAPDTIVVVGDDQHENLVDDNMPPFTLFIGKEVEASTSLRYLNQPHTENRTRYDVDAELALSVLESLMENGFDPSYSKKTRYEGGLGHAFARVLKFLSPDARYAILPVMVNTYYPPAPSAKRCVEFGRAMADAIRAFPQSRRVVVVGSGGLSHTKIDERLDADLIQALTKNDQKFLQRMESAALVQGTSEIRNWIVTAAAADRPATIVDYQPLYRTMNGVGCAMGFAAWG